MEIKTIIFDLGGVLIDWNPRYLFRNYFNDEEAMEWFLTNITTPEWNGSLDAGVPFQDGVNDLVKKYPDYTEPINMYHQRWEEMLAGEITSTVKVLEALKDTDYRLYALTNWSHETFPIARKRFPFLNIFEGIVVSGEERLIKPDHALYNIILNKFSIEPGSTVFIDDSIKNIDAAQELGLHTIHFNEATTDLVAELKKLGVEL